MHCDLWRSSGDSCITSRSNAASTPLVGILVFLSNIKNSMEVLPDQTSPGLHDYLCFVHSPMLFHIQYRGQSRDTWKIKLLETVIATKRLAFQWHENTKDAVKTLLADSFAMSQSLQQEPGLPPFNPQQPPVYCSIVPIMAVAESRSGMSTNSRAHSFEFGTGLGFGTSRDENLSSEDHMLQSGQL